MRQFISIREFTNWLIHDCEEPFPYSRFERDFEACLWMPLDYLTSILSPTAFTDLTEKVTVLDEVQIP